MSQNPFDAPKVPLQGPSFPAATGRIDVGAALSGGWQLTKENFFTWLGVYFVGILLVVLSAALFIVPVFVVGPAIAYGFVYYHLECYEGRGEFKNLFEGFNRLGPAVGGFLALILVYVLIGLPGQALQAVGQQTENPLISLVGVALGLVVGIVGLRWYFAPYFIVDQGFGGFEAIKASWRATQGSWLNLFLFALAATLLIFVGVLLLIVGAIPASATMSFGIVVAYRQLVGETASA